MGKKPHKTKQKNPSLETNKKIKYFFLLVAFVV